MRILRLSTRRSQTCSFSRRPRGGAWAQAPPRGRRLNVRGVLFRGKRMLRSVLLCQDFVDFRLVFHGALDRQFGCLVVVVVDLLVILGIPMNEYAADDDEVIRFTLGNYAGSDAVG